MIIRPAVESDAQALVTMQNQLDRETTFMMFEPGERTTTITEQQARIKNQPNNAALFVAEVDGQLLGFISGRAGNNRRIAHSVYLVMGILKAHHGQGIGSALMQALLDWSDQQGFARVELSVMPHNHAGRALYSKFGFQPEGTQRCAMMVGGEYVDLIMMARLNGVEVNKIEGALK